MKTRDKKIVLCEIKFSLLNTLIRVIMYSLEINNQAATIKTNNHDGTHLSLIPLPTTYTRAIGVSGLQCMGNRLFDYTLRLLVKENSTK